MDNECVPVSTLNLSADILFEMLQTSHEDRQSYLENFQTYLVIILVT